MEAPRFFFSSPLSCSYKLKRSIGSGRSKNEASVVACHGHGRDPRNASSILPSLAQGKGKALYTRRFSSCWSDLPYNALIMYPKMADDEPKARFGSERLSPSRLFL